MDSRYYDFFDKPNFPTRLQENTQADIDKFITVKSDLIPAKIETKLLAYLHDLTKAFLPRDARSFPLKRLWDHKIEILPEKSPRITKPNLCH
jgi:hypothetical protein